MLEDTVRLIGSNIDRHLLYLFPRLILLCGKVKVLINYPPSWYLKMWGVQPQGRGVGAGHCRCKGLTRHRWARLGNDLPWRETGVNEEG